MQTSRKLRIVTETFTLRKLPLVEDRVTLLKQMRIGGKLQLALQINNLMVRAVILRKDNHAAVPGLIKGKIDSDVIEKTKAFLIASVAAVGFCVTTNLLDREGYVAFLLCFEDKKNPLYLTLFALGGEGGGCHVFAHIRSNIRITPLSAQISASKFQILSPIPLKIRGVWKNCGVWLKNFKSQTLFCMILGIPLWFLDMHKWLGQIGLNFNNIPQEGHKKNPHM